MHSYSLTYCMRAIVTEKCLCACGATLSICVAERYIRSGTRNRRRRTAPITSPTPPSSSLLLLLPLPNDQNTQTSPSLHFSAFYFVFCFFLSLLFVCFALLWWALNTANERMNERTHKYVHIQIARRYFALSIVVFFSSFIIFLNRALSDGKLNAVSSSCALPVTASHSTSENVFSTTVHHSTVDDYMIGCEFIQYFFFAFAVLVDFRFLFLFLFSFASSILKFKCFSFYVVRVLRVSCGNWCDQSIRIDVAKKLLKLNYTLKFSNRFRSLCGFCCWFFSVQKFRYVSASSSTSSHKYFIRCKCVCLCERVRVCEYVEVLNG